MNKSKMMLMVTGGVIALAVLIAAVFAWLAFSAKTAALEGDEESEGLESAVSRLSGLQRQKPAPSEANRTRLNENCQTLTAWREMAFRQASAGDWSPDGNMTPAKFKADIVTEAKAFVSLTNAFGEALMKADFAFGPFGQYLADKLPPESELVRLQRQWFDISSLLSLLANKGVKQISGLEVVDRTSADAQAAAKQRQRKPVKKTAKASFEPSVETYKLSFQAEPDALVSVLHELSFQERFTVVDGLAFSRAADVIAETLGGSEKKSDAASASTGRRGRRRGAVVEVKADDSEKKRSVAFDPARDAAFQVELKVSVYDFRTLEETKEEGASK